MPIFDRKDWGCFRQFHAHVQELIGSVLPGVQQLKLEGRAGDRFAYLRFIDNPDGRPSVTLTTNVGEIELYIKQYLEAIFDKKRGDYRLSTRKYWYHLYERGAPDAFMRWEYVSDSMDSGAKYPRHHLHVHTTMPLAVGPTDLTHLHAPTGWVLIEEVLRFLIQELGVSPGCNDWHERLRAGEDRFYKEFTSKRA